LGRDPLAPTKHEQLVPGPGHYNPKAPKNYIVQGKQKASFGGNAPRESLMFRNVAVNPFKDPTMRKSPSPQKYQNNSAEI